MSDIFQPNTGWQPKSATANLAQAAGTYDLVTAVGDVLIDTSKVAMYMATVGATFTSVSIQSNQTSVVTVLTALEGAVANLTAQKQIVHVFPTNSVLHLASGQKLQYTIIGATGTGSMIVDIPFMPMTMNASLT